MEAADLWSVGTNGFQENTAPFSKYVDESMEGRIFLWASHEAYGEWRDRPIHS
jgi:hypothetical protein